MACKHYCLFLYVWDSLLVSFRLNTGHVWLRIYASVIVSVLLFLWLWFNFNSTAQCCSVFHGWFTYKNNEWHNACMLHVPRHFRYVHVDKISPLGKFVFYRISKKTSGKTLLNVLYVFIWACSNARCLQVQECTKHINIQHSSLCHISLVHP